MAKLSDLKLKYRLYMQAYPYRHIDWRPSAQLQKPFSDSKIAMVTSAAFYGADQRPFDSTIRGGDYSYREIPDAVALETLRIGHKSDAFDHTGIERDKNLALPLDRFREFKQEGVIGEVAQRHYSLMGSITAPARLVSITAPEIVRSLAEDRVDAVLLTPVWPMCHQSVGLVQSVIEKAGIPTVSITLLPEMTRRVRPPRALAVDRPLGYPLGEPGNTILQKDIIKAALQLLHEPVPEPLIVEFREASSAGSSRGF